MLPAGVVSGMDHQDKLVFVSRTKDLIKNSPEFSDDLFKDMKYREQLGSYYGEEGAGWYNTVVRLIQAPFEQSPGEMPGLLLCLATGRRGT